MKQREDKVETLRKYKESNDELMAKFYSERVKVRQLKMEILEKSQDLIKIDEEILETCEDMRKIKQTQRENDMNVWDLKMEFDDSQEEYRKTESNPTLDKTSAIPTWRLQDHAKQKVYVIVVIVRIGL